jgi:hypothetical protein
VISQVLRKGPDDTMSAYRQLNSTFELPTVVSVSTKGIYHIMSEAERNHLGFLERLALLEWVSWEQNGRT